MEEKHIILSGQIKKLREEKKWTKKQMAEKLCIDCRTLRIYEEGSSNMTIDTLIRYTEIFQVSLDYLLFGTEISTVELCEKINKLSQKQKKAIMAIIESY
ncbi:helix-turn-helix domain-containing protein [Mediterraneibacter gnavus]|uniref:helix-turn-helix domain-containing protein n=1 Tax=Mediterraneibacter gnavus TaxID=33038 RepID=UPI003671B308